MGLALWILRGSKVQFYKGTKEAASFGFSTGSFEVYGGGRMDEFT